MSIASPEMCRSLSVKRTRIVFEPAASGMLVACHVNEGGDPTGASRPEAPVVRFLQPAATTSDCGVLGAPYVATRDGIGFPWGGVGVPHCAGRAGVVMRATRNATGANPPVHTASEEQSLHPPPSSPGCGY